MFEPEDMPDTDAVTAAKPGEPRYLPWLSIFVLWALVQAVILAVGASPVLEGGLIGTDGYMRLVRVELLQETGAWFDGRIPRSNAPYGDTLHWTRPFDVLLLGAAWLLTPFLGFEKALFWGGSFVSPVLLLVSALVMTWASRPVIDAQFQPYVTFAFFAQLAVLIYSLPGRIDHHSLQIFLLVLTIGLVLRLCAERPRRGSAVLTGVVLGIGLWVSVEFLLVVLLVAAALWLSWLRGGAAKAAPAVGLAVGLAGSVAIALLIERPIEAMLIEEHDRISVVHLTLVLVHLLFWALVVLGERAAGIAPALRARLTFSLLGAVASGVAIYLAFPKFFGGAMAHVDPEVVRVYLSKVKELQPVLPSDARTFGQFLFWVGPAVICLPYVLAQVWLKRRDDAWIGWVFFAIALGLYLTLSLRHVRFAPFAETMAVVPLVHLIGAARGRLSWIASQTWRDAARSLVSLVLIIGISGAGLVLGFRPSPGTGASAFGAAGAGAGTGECDIAAIAAFLNRPEPFGDRPGIIATHVDFGPELLYRTEHGVVGAPYHRNARGILDIYRIFSAADGSVSKTLLDARGIELVLLCPSPREQLLYASEAEGATLYERLIDGRTPGWLEPVALPERLAARFRLYRVLQ
jgi:hypothetical protein